MYLLKHIVVDTKYKNRRKLSLAFYPQDGFRLAFIVTKYAKHTLRKPNYFRTQFFVTINAMKMAHCVAYSAKTSIHFMRSEFLIF